jgi:hypothetical protein
VAPPGERKSVRDMVFVTRINGKPVVLSAGFPLLKGIVLIEMINK